MSLSPAITEEVYPAGAGVRMRVARSDIYVLLSLSAYARATRENWHLMPAPDGRIYRWYYNAAGKRRKQFLAQFVMGVEGSTRERGKPGTCIRYRHKNGDPLDFRESNLSGVAREYWIHAAHPREHPERSGRLMRPERRLPLRARFRYRGKDYVIRQPTADALERALERARPVVEVARAAGVSWREFKARLDRRLGVVRPRVRIACSDSAYADQSNG